MSIEPTKGTQRRRAAAERIEKEPDLVDRVFAYILAELPEVADRAIEIKREIRRQLGGSEHYVRNSEADLGAQRAADVLRLFNGRNASEVARQLGTSRATVYRALKQPGKR